MRRLWMIACAAALAAAACGDGKCEDADGDGYCAEPDPVCDPTQTVIASCFTPPADCDDSDPDTHPYAVEKPNDGIDQDCNGADATESCDGVSDGDLDGLKGCADPQCAEKCDATRASLCAPATTREVTEAGVQLNGTLPAGLDTMQPSCFTGQTAEQVVRLVPGKPGQIGALEISVSGNAVGFSLRKACDDDASEIACGKPFDTARTLVVKGGEPLDMIVDGDAFFTSPMPWSGFATFRPAICGDGVVIAPEGCDDGGTTDGDGCSATCAFEPAFYCAGATPIEPGYTTLDFSPETAPKGFSGSCYGEWGYERVLVFTPPEDGQVAVGVEGSVGLYARSSCEDPATELACRKQTDAGVNTLTVPAKKGEPVFFFVDGLYTQFELTTVFFAAQGP